jgi:hypothetical protein
MTEDGWQDIGYVVDDAERLPIWPMEPFVPENREVRRLSAMFPMTLTVKASFLGRPEGEYQVSRQTRQGIEFTEVPEGTTRIFLAWAALGPIVDRELTRIRHEVRPMPLLVSKEMAERLGLTHDGRQVYVQDPDAPEPPE